jgi:hypothetical protein
MDNQIGGIVASWTNEGEATLERVGELCSRQSPSVVDEEGRSLAGGENLAVRIIRDRKSNTTLANHYAIYLALIAASPSSIPSTQSTSDPRNTA